MDPKQPEFHQIPRPIAGRKRRFTAAEKQQLLREASSPGESISSVSRRYGISSSLIFKWRKLTEDGSLSSLKADEAVVPESEAKQLRAQVRELQRLLCKKTMENEILREAVEVAGQKKTVIARKIAQANRFPLRRIADALRVFEVKPSRNPARFAPAAAAMRR